MNKITLLLPLFAILLIGLSPSPINFEREYVEIDGEVYVIEFDGERLNIKSGNDNGGGNDSGDNAGGPPFFRETIANALILSAYLWGILYAFITENWRLLFDLVVAGIISVIVIILGKRLFRFFKK